MTSMTDEEWNTVQEALVIGGLRSCIDEIIASRFREPRPVLLSDRNRRIIEQAYDDGDGNSITLVPRDDYPWFSGMYDDQEVMQGVEHNGTLFSVTSIGGGGIVSVIVGLGLVRNEIGVVFPNTVGAKEYVQGLMAK